MRPGFGFADNTSGELKDRRDESALRLLLRLPGRPGFPLQSPEGAQIAPGRIDEVHRLIPAGESVAGFLSPTSNTEFWQVAAHVEPAVWIEAGPLGQNTGILEMTKTYVVGRQSQPGSVRLLQPSRQSGFEINQVARRPQNSVARHQSVYIELTSCSLGEHHQPSDACRRARVRTPAGFLIGHGGEQTPVEIGSGCRCDKVFTEIRQALLIVPKQCPRVEVVEFFCGTEIPLGDAIQRAVRPDALKVI